MKAAILEGYSKGGRELVVKDIPMPEVGSHDLLVRIKTAGVNPLDNMIIRLLGSGCSIQKAAGTELRGRAVQYRNVIYCCER